MERPQIVTMDEWQVSRDALLEREKASTRALDALAAERRRLPMVRIEQDYIFEGPNGPARFVDLFEGRRQLVVYHFMFGPGEERPRVGCSSFTDNIGDLTHLNERATTFALMSRAPRDELVVYEQRMGWDLTWYSSFANSFNRDFGLTTDRGETFGLHVYLRDGEDVFLTYRTNGRGVDRLRLDFNLLDLTPFGRQETWEDSPEGWPQTAPYQWWRRRDEYEGAIR
ncbi:MAG: DUF899 domain-containing protein [Gaiellales bacterium]